MAREVFWKHGLDYNHGTGHGIGYLLNVHERPAGIRFRVDVYKRQMVGSATIRSGILPVATSIAGILEAAAQ